MRVRVTRPRGLSRSDVGDSLRRSLRLVVVFAVLAALPAMLVPASAANLGLADTADGLPVAPQSLQTFPVVSAVGLMWEQARPEDPPVDHYIVKRQRHNGHWEDVSPPLTETHWLDTSVAPGESNEYYVVAVNAEGEGPGGGIITGTRPVADPAIGSIDALVVDAGPGIAGSVLTTEVAEPVTASERQGSVRYLSAGDIRIKIPALIPGPGYYDLAPHSEFEIEQNGVTCPNLDYPKLKVSELLYTQDLRLAMMAAEFELMSCGNGGPQTDYGAIRIDSTEPYSAIAVTPTTLDFGRVRRGTTAERSVTLTNTGMTSLTISAAQVAYGYQHVWQARNECTEPLAPGAACTVVVGFTPDSNLSRDARIRIYDSTARGTRFVDASGMGESVPFAPDVDVRRTFTGIDVSWSPPADTGGWPLTGFVVHRTAGGTTTRYPLPVEQHRWIDPDPPAGASYSVSAVNQLGEGWASQPQSPAAAREQLTMFTGRTTQQAVLSGVAIWHGSQPVPIGTSAPAGTRTEVTTSPDGRHVAYTLADGENQVLWISRLDGTGSRKLSERREIHDPSWSPDGTRIAFTTHVDASTPCVDIVNAVDGGTPVRVGCGIEFPAWHPDAQTLLVRDSRLSGAPVARVSARADGGRLLVVAGSSGALKTVISPDGRWLAFATSDNRVAILPAAGGTPQYSRAFEQGVVKALSWRPDGRVLGVLYRRNEIDAISAVGVPDGVPDTPSFMYAGTEDEYIADFVWHGIGLLVGPTPAVVGPSTSIQFDTSALAPASTVTCQLDQSAAAACTTPFRLSGLTTGTHTVQIKAVEQTPGEFPHEVVAARTFVADATGPTTRVVSPTYGATTAATATVRFAGTDVSGISSYDVRYRRAPFNGPFGGFNQPWTGLHSTTVDLALTPGYEYCVSARARDQFGNVGAWSAERCFARPMDDRSLTAATAGWARTSWSAFYLGTATQTGTYGASLTRAVQGKRFYLLATKCPTCGTASVYLGGRYLTAVNLSAATTQRQALVALPAQSSVFSSTLRITSRSAGKLVQIDGLAVRRT